MADPNNPSPTPTPTPIPCRPNDLIIIALDALAERANSEGHAWTSDETNSYNLARGFAQNAPIIMEIPAPSS